jgi:hypothetical protein
MTDRNISIWDYYRQGYIDPMYAPYQKVKVPVRNGAPVSGQAIQAAANRRDLRASEGGRAAAVGGSASGSASGNMCYIGVERGEVQSDVKPNLDAVYPEIVRKGQGLSFQRMFSTDPCPPGYIRQGLNWCVRDADDFEPVFYTDAYYGKRGYYPPTESYVSQRWRSTYSDDTLPFLQQTAWSRNAGGRQGLQQNYAAMPLSPMLL